MCVCVQPPVATLGRRRATLHHLSRRPISKQPALAVNSAHFARLSTAEHNGTPLGPCLWVASHTWPVHRGREQLEAVSSVCVSVCSVPEPDNHSHFQWQVWWCLNSPVPSILPPVYSSTTLLLSAPLFAIPFLVHIPELTIRARTIH